MPIYDVWDGVTKFAAEIRASDFMAGIDRAWSWNQAASLVYRPHSF